MQISPLDREKDGGIPGIFQKANHSLRGCLVLCVIFWMAGCAGDRRHQVLISVTDQSMVVLRDGRPLAWYPVSTSKFGLGDKPGSNATPLGKFEVRQKIGDGLPPGAVLKSRKPTGEILPVNAPGRDPIVTRILWLHGLEQGNKNSFSRYIYIHGTPEERNLGLPVSYGCIRMGSRDVIALYDTVGKGARVHIFQAPLPAELRPQTPEVAGESGPSQTTF